MTWYEVVILVCVVVSVIGIGMIIASLEDLKKRIR